MNDFRHDLKSINSDKSSIDKIGDYFELRKAEINQDYKEHNNNRNIKKGTKLYQEGVITFGRNQFDKTSPSDITTAAHKFCDSFEKKHGCKILMASLHMDEGHKDNTDSDKHNYHIHVLIENYSFNTHKTCLQKLSYSELQTDLAKDFEHLGFQRGKDYKKLQEQENKQAALEGREPVKVKPVHLRHKEYREMKERERLLQQEQSQEMSAKNQVIQNFRQKLEDTELELSNLDTLYKQTREELKATKEAKQTDYQELKKLVDTQKLEIARHMELTRLEHERYEKLQKEKEAEKAKHNAEAKEFQEKTETLKNELQTEKIHNTTLVNENQKLHIENHQLKSAIERFLDLPIIKGATDALKTLLGVCRASQVV